jgi:hypothetical protein
MHLTHSLKAPGLSPCAYNSQFACKRSIVYRYAVDEEELRVLLIALQGTHPQIGLAIFTLFSPEFGLWVGTFHHVIQSRTRVMGWHFSRYFAVNTHIDDSQHVPCH